MRVRFHHQGNGNIIHDDCGEPLERFQARGRVILLCPSCEVHDVLDAAAWRLEYAAAPTRPTLARLVLAFLGC